jgi:hypothetical protein
MKQLRVPQAGSPASLLAGVEVREPNLGLFCREYWGKGIKQPPSRHQGSRRA